MFGGDVAQPVEKGLQCDRLNLHVVILAHFAVVRQRRAFGSAATKRGIELSTPLKEDFPTEYN
jgi:hypothetical protein